MTMVKTLVQLKSVEARKFDSFSVLSNVSAAVTEDRQAARTRYR